MQSKILLCIYFSIEIYSCSQIFAATFYTQNQLLRLMGSVFGVLGELKIADSSIIDNMHHLNSMP